MRKNNKRGGQMDMAVNSSQGLDYDRDIMNNANLTPENKIGALFMLTGGCINGQCTNIQPESPLASALNQYAETKGADAAIQLVGQWRQANIQLLTSVCQALANQDVTAMEAVQKDFNQTFPLESIGGPFSRGSAGFLVQQWGLVDHSSGQSIFNPNYQGQCNAILASLGGHSGGKKKRKKSKKKKSKTKKSKKN